MKVYLDGFIEDPTHFSGEIGGRTAMLTDEIIDQHHLRTPLENFGQRLVLQLSGLKDRFGKERVIGVAIQSIEFQLILGPKESESTDGSE